MGTMIVTITGIGADILMIDMIMKMKTGHHEETFTKKGNFTTYMTGEDHMPNNQGTARTS